MLITCTTKGCMETTEAKLDKNINEVICQSCGNVINGITPFMKKSLLNIGQVLRGKLKKAFQSFCKNCNESRSLYVKDNKAYCEVCNSQVIVSEIFLSALKNNLKEKKGKEELE